MDPTPMIVYSMTSWFSGRNVNVRMSDDSTVQRTNAFKGDFVIGSSSNSISEYGKKESLDSEKVTRVALVMELMPVKKITTAISQDSMAPNLFPQTSTKRFTLANPVLTTLFPFITSMMLLGLVVYSIVRINANPTNPEITIVSIYKQSGFQSK